MVWSCHWIPCHLDTCKVNKTWESKNVAWKWHVQTTVQDSVILVALEKGWISASCSSLLLHLLFFLICHSWWYITNTVKAFLRKETLSCMCYCLINEGSLSSIHQSLYWPVQNLCALLVYLRYLFKYLQCSLPILCWHHADWHHVSISTFDIKFSDL